MPSNVFANTGTNVSVLFFDKSASTDLSLIHILAMCILTEIYDVKRFRNENQFASYLGLIPTLSLIHI